MTDWPYDKQVYGPPDGPAGATRMLNLMVPISLENCRADIHMILPEAQARQIANLTPDQAAILGEFFVLIKDGIESFIASEG